LPGKEAAARGERALDIGLGKESAMPTRRTFLGAAAAVAAAGLTGTVDAAPAQAAPKGPSAFATAIAKSLQQQMPRAQLTDSLVEKIAGDIDGYASVAADFRNATLHNWNEPDFVFSAAPQGPTK
jgi:hypothetical protein